MLSLIIMHMVDKSLRLCKKKIYLYLALNSVQQNVHWWFLTSDCTQIQWSKLLSILIFETKISRRKPTSGIQEQFTTQVASETQLKPE